MKPVLAVDFDDVVFPFMQQFVPHYNQRYGANFHIDDYWTFEFDKVWHEELEEAWHRVSTFFEESHIDFLPVEGAQTALDELRASFDLIVVTARDETLSESTSGWIAQHLPECFTDIILCNSFVVPPGCVRRTKAEVVEKYDAVGLIDDSLRNATDVAATGRRSYLYGEFPWNRAEELPHGVTRHLSWPSIVKELIG